MVVLTATRLLLWLLSQFREYVLWELTWVTVIFLVSAAKKKSCCKKNQEGRDVGGLTVVVED